MDCHPHFAVNQLHQQLISFYFFFLWRWKTDSWGCQRSQCWWLHIIQFRLRKRRRLSGKLQESLRARTTKTTPARKLQRASFSLRYEKFVSFILWCFIQSLYLNFNCKLNDVIKDLSAESLVSNLRTYFVVCKHSERNENVGYTGADALSSLQHFIFFFLFTGCLMLRQQTFHMSLILELWRKEV